MSDQPSPPPPTQPPDTPTTPPPPQPPPSGDAEERLREMMRHKKSLEQKHSALERQFKEVASQLEERENANLPELERMRKQYESMEKRLQDESRARQEAEQTATRVHRENLVASAAAALDFRDPQDAPLFVSLDEIETRQDAERAIKALKKQKDYLFKQDDKLPGQVVQNGQQVAHGMQQETPAMTESDQTLLAEIQQKMSDGWSSTTFG